MIIFRMTPADLAFFQPLRNIYLHNFHDIFYYYLTFYCLPLISFNGFKSFYFLIFSGQFLQWCCYSFANILMTIRESSIKAHPTSITKDENICTNFKGSPTSWRGFLTLVIMSYDITHYSITSL